MWVTAGRRAVLAWCPAPSVGRGSLGAAAAATTATAVRPVAATRASRGRRPLWPEGGVHRQGVTTMAASGFPKIDAYALGTPNGTLAEGDGGRGGGLGLGGHVLCGPPGIDAFLVGQDRELGLSLGTGSVKQPLVRMPSRGREVSVNARSASTVEHQSLARL